MPSTDRPTRDELLLYMRVPVWYRRKCLLLIDAFTRDELGFTLHESGFDHMPQLGRLAFCFDGHNNNVPTPPPDGQAANGEWIWRLAASSRAPLITCETRFLKVMPEMNTTRPGGVYALTETPPRAQAVEWTLRIAREFDLRYVDAKTLRDWQVSYDDVDPAFADALEHQPDDPNAFQVLFLEN